MSSDDFDGLLAVVEYLKIGEIHLLDGRGYYYPMIDVRMTLENFPVIRDTLRTLLRLYRRVLRENGLYIKHQEFRNIQLHGFQWIMGGYQLTRKAPRFVYRAIIEQYDFELFLLEWQYEQLRLIKEQYAER